MSDYLAKLTNELLNKDGPIQEELDLAKKQINELKQKRKILIVDDKPDNVLIIKLLLKSEGYEIFTAQNGLEAVNIYKENSDISKIYMDMRMPVMNGEQASKLIRSFEQEHSITPCEIIAVTAYAEYEYEDKYKDFGIDSVILKPFTKSRLLDSQKSKSDIHIKSI